ncbi:MAG: glutamate synthase-related protein, partial [Candidatus Thiodiazotropha sp.]
TIAFGSTRDLRPTGSVLFVNCPYPTLGEDAVPATEVVIGPGCKTPYTTDSLINISGMSYGALSVPAIRALSAGARQAGCWMNTGEGGSVTLPSRRRCGPGISNRHCQIRCARPGRKPL